MSGEKETVELTGAGENGIKMRKVGDETRSQIDSSGRGGIRVKQTDEVLRLADITIAVTEG